TELLARQHLNTFTELLAPFGVRTALLTSGMGKKQRSALLHALECGEIDLLCGTHALLEPDVRFHAPALLVIDEQHRFGVRQRAALSEKAEGAHLLFMSATPIPRTLTLILYGELELSVLDELPPGRRPVQTCRIGRQTRERA